MKTRLILLLFAGIITCSFIIRSPVAETGGPHGGIVKSAGAFNIELKTSGTSTFAYLLDKKSRSLNNKGMTCEIQFFFPDSTQLDVSLKPYDSDGFKTEANVQFYYACRVNFNLPGRIVSAKFENQNIFVNKKQETPIRH